MNTQRHTGWKVHAVLTDINSGVTVELGDLMFLDSANNLRNDGNSIASNYAYPFEYFRLSGASLQLNKLGVKDYFFGVALDDVDGVNNTIIKKIDIGTAGKYEYPLKPAKTVLTSQYFGASGTTAASNLFNQKVMKVIDSDYALGYFAERKKHALKAEVVIMPAFSVVQKI